MSSFGDISGQRAARLILGHSLDHVLPERALRRHVRLDEPANTLIVAGRAYPLENYKKIFVVGGGKAAWRIGAELANMLGDRIKAGILNVYQDQAENPITANIRLFGAGHPIPNEAGVAGAGQMIELLRLADRETLVIALISGGGSSMMALPAEGLTLEDLRAMSRSLLTVPASIDEMNAVRKHIDPLKGGGMRKNAENAGGFMTLVLSDVPVTKTGIADDPSVISSGPTVGDDSTFGEAIKVLTEHGIWEQTPAAIRKYLQDNSDQDDNETLPKDSPLLSEAKSQYVILANNDQAMEAAAEKAVELGYHIRLIGCRNGSIVNKIKAEVTQEIENIWNVITPSLTPQDRVTFASFSTDGVDGHSDLAGAIAENNTLRLAKQKGLEYKTYLTDFDSASFFKQLGLGIEIGPTGTNVADIILVLMNNSERKLAFIFGGEATVKMTLPEGQKPGFGGRNTHLALLAAEKLNHLQ